MLSDSMSSIVLEETCSEKKWTTEEEIDMIGDEMGSLPLSLRFSLFSDDGSQRQNRTATV